MVMEKSKFMDKESKHTAGFINPYMDQFRQDFKSITTAMFVRVLIQHILNLEHSLKILWPQYDEVDGFKLVNPCLEKRIHEQKYLQLSLSKLEIQLGHFQSLERYMD